MAYDPGAIDATLAAALGDDAGLIAELRLAFVEGAERTVAAMAKAGSPAEWTATAQRLKGLAASFGAVRLMALADQAAQSDVDQAMVKRLQQAVARL